MTSFAGYLLWSLAMFAAGAGVAFAAVRQIDRRNRRKFDFSSDQLEAFFEHAPVGMAIHDLEGRYIYASRQTTMEYGMSEEDLKNRSMQSIGHLWPDADEIAQVMGDVARGEIRWLLKPLHTPNEPEPKYYNVIMFPIRSASGEIVQIGALGMDVTSQRRAEAAVIQREAQLTSLFEHVPADISIYGQDHKVVMVNQSTADQYGMQPEDFVGEHPTFYREHWDDHDEIIASGIEVLETGIPKRFTTTFRPPAKGGEIKYDTMFFPIRSENGEIEQVGLFLFDVTKQFEAEKLLAEQREQSHQSEKLAALGQLLAGVAHELNNPLTVVVGRSAILEEKLADTPHGKALSDIREAADRCNRIVTTFLAMARQSAPRRTSVRVNDTLDAALEMVAYNLRTSGVEIVRELDRSLPAVAADEDQLVQVFTNILVNAGHALEDRDAARIRVSTRVENGAVVAEFADNGPGVPDDLATRIFEPFFTTKAVGDGTGMGLAMSKGMIEEHGGSLEYREAQGGGAVFTVSLPASEGADETAPAVVSREPVGNRDARVLIVDDEPAIRGMLAEILGKVGMDSVQCGDGAEALAALDNGQFDLIFCDVRMPVMDGVRFRQNLVEQRPELIDRLIFMSGDVLQRSGERYAPIADHPIIDKPFRPSEVRELALAALDMHGVH